MFPKSLRYEINAGREISLVSGLQRLRTEILGRLQPDSVLLFDTHWFTTVEFVVSAHESKHGVYTSGEFPRGMAQVPHDLKSDPEFARPVSEKVEQNGVPSDYENATGTGQVHVWFE